MSEKPAPRKCTFNLFPAHGAGDKVACDLIDEVPLKERGRIMRAMLLTGAALMLQDKRLPDMISAFLTENTSFADIQRLIGSVLPESQLDQDTVRSLLAHLQGAPATAANGQSVATVIPAPEVPAPPQENEAAAQTRANSSKLFRDGDDE
ncbi:plasmid partitioning/stability family protein [Serratia quinivorans]|uniref:plasmid partitioning/stability family protein n=1 Tax=Serratia quinivorans TaxID=137545 RepID=UPI0034C67A25